MPFKNSPHRTSTEHWRTQPLRSSLSLSEGQLFSTLFLRLVASPGWLWPGVLEGKRSRDIFFVIFDCFDVAFELVRGAQFTRNQAYSGCSTACRQKTVPTGGPAGYESMSVPLHVDDMRLAV